ARGGPRRRGWRLAPRAASDWLAAPFAPGRPTSRPVGRRRFARFLPRERYNRLARRPDKAWALPAGPDPRRRAASGLLPALHAPTVWLFAFAPLRTRFVEAVRR